MVVLVITRVLDVGELVKNFASDLGVLVDFSVDIEEGLERSRSVQFALGTIWLGQPLVVRQL